MIDFQCFPGESPATDPQSALLQRIVACLSDADLAALEDDLDFYRFAHMPSPRMLAILGRVGALDAGWSVSVDAAIALPAVASRRMQSQAA